MDVFAVIGGVVQYLNRMAYLAHPDRLVEEREAAEGERGGPAASGDAPEDS